MVNTVVNVTIMTDNSLHFNQLLLEIRVSIDNLNMLFVETGQLIEL